MASDSKTAGKRDPKPPITHKQVKEIRLRYRKRIDQLEKLVFSLDKRNHMLEKANQELRKIFQDAGNKLGEKEVEEFFARGFNRGKP